MSKRLIITDTDMITMKTINLHLDELTANTLPKMSRCFSGLGMIFCLNLVAVPFILANIGTAYAEDNRWNGVYASINAGLGVNKVKLRSQHLAFTTPGEQCTVNSDFSTFASGLQLGFLYRPVPNLLSGIEANVSVNANSKDTLNCTCLNNSDVSDRFSFKNKMQSSIKARGGPALNWNKKLVFPYLTAGASITSTGLTYSNESSDYYSKSTNRGGWLIGAGIEWALGNKWSLRAEYNHTEYRSTSVRIPSVYGLIDFNGQARADQSNNNIGVAISYWI